MLRLIVHFDGRVATVPLRDRELSIGSAAGNDVVIPSVGVSRRHAIVKRHGGTVVIEDVGSKNGLRVGGKRVTRFEFSGGSAVQVGRALLRVEEVSSGDAAIALPIEQRTSSVAGMIGTASFPAAGMPREVLMWARAAEAHRADISESERAELIARAREIAEWDAVVRYGNVDGRIVIRELHGFVSDELPAAGESDGHWLVVPLAAKEFVAAHATSANGWGLEFLEYVALRLFAPEIETRRQLTDAVSEASFPTGMVRAESPAMRGLYEQLRAAAASDLSILLRGESGTGKEWFARLAHAWSRAATGPFCALNCAEIPAELLEAELFGIRKGVATGVEARQGLFADARGGTVFLDEIGDMPPRLQAKLLRVLQEREVRPLGASVPVKVDVRIVASTNRDLQQMIAEGSFRHDLYYRLRGIELTIPPLRERREDIPPLVFAFVSEAARRNQKNVRGVSQKALSILTQYDWPGNVRELRNTIEAAVVLARRGAALESSHFAQLVRPEAVAAGALQERVNRTERDAVLEALRQAGGNKTAAARILGVTRAGLYLKLKRFGIE